MEYIQNLRKIPAGSGEQAAQMYMGARFQELEREPLHKAPWSNLPEHIGTVPLSAIAEQNEHAVPLIAYKK